MGVHTAYSIIQCSDAPEHASSLARAFTALAHAQIGRTYGIFFQSILRRDLVCMQSCQSLHCSHMCTKWAYIWHIQSVNAHTPLSMRTVSQEPSLLSHMHKMGVYMAYSFSQSSNVPESLCSLVRAFTALAHTPNGYVYGIFYQSMLKQALPCVQSHQSLHCFHKCAKWAYIWHISSVYAQTSLRVCAVLPEPSLLSHMHKMGVHKANFC